MLFLLMLLTNLFQMKSFSKYNKLLIGAGAIFGTAVYYFKSDKGQVFNSWTTNYILSTPLAKWDDNWDQ